MSITTPTSPSAKPAACRFDASVLARNELLAREEQACVVETLRTYRETPHCVRMLQDARKCDGGEENALVSCTDAQLTEICDVFLAKNYTDEHAREYCAAVTNAKRAFWMKQAGATVAAATDAGRPVVES